MPEISETLAAPNRCAWRRWLEKHHASKSEIWLVYFKKYTGKASIRYNESVEEALCFGWIDGIRKRIDAERYAHRFSPRQKNSVWSTVNKKRVQKMAKAGKMTDAGWTAVCAAKKNGKWEHATAGPKVDDTVSSDLQMALARNSRARKHFEAFAPSYRRLYLQWVNAAKRADTRKRRISEVVQRASQNKKPGLK